MLKTEMRLAGSDLQQDDGPRLNLKPICGMDAIPLSCIGNWREAGDRTSEEGVSF